LESAKLLLSLSRKASKGEYVSPEDKSPYQLLESFIDVVEKFSEHVGLDVEETVESNKAIAEAEESTEQAPEPVSVDGKLIRVGGPAIPVTANGDATKPYDANEDPLNPKKLNIEVIIKKDGLGVYKDQAGRLWTGLATYWIKRAEFDRAKHTFETGLKNVLTVRDFNQIFDSYGEFGQSLMDALMESLRDEEDEEEMAETEKELDQQMKDFEELADRRPFLLNDVMIRRNPNDVQEWEKRVALWGDDDEKVAETYTQALETINPRKATPNFHRLYITFARFYEEGGVSGEAEPDFDSARKILEKATKVNFKSVDDLAEIWCEWAEMELRHECVCFAVLSFNSTNIYY
jgi:pre-mRNA-splicing factor SYF1